MTSDMKHTISGSLAALTRSAFRSGFRLNPSQIEYVRTRGIEIITQHAYDFIQKRIAPANPKNDGKQTPMKGHPVFVAQHATATCCRGCIRKWYHIPPDRPLTEDEIDFTVTLIMAWIQQHTPEAGNSTQKG